MIVEGHVSIRAVIQAARRPVHCIYILQGKKNRSVANLVRMARQRSIQVEYVDQSVIDMYATGSHHGGVVAQVGERDTQTPRQLILNIPNPFITLLDGVEDPYNLGQAVRAIYAAGAHGLILPVRNWTTALSVVTRSSAGATERIPTSIVDDIPNAVSTLKSQGLEVIATDSDVDLPSMFDVNLCGPILLMIGGERRGIGKRLMHLADVRIRVPYARNFAQSLDITSAAAVLAFEVMRQRRVQYTLYAK